MKVVIRTVIVQHYCYLPLYYYRCTTTAVPVWIETGERYTEQNIT